MPGLFTVTLTAALEPTLPPASYALATMLWLPLPPCVVSHDTEYGAVVSVPMTELLTKKVTRVTPTLSLAFAETVVVPTMVEPPAGAVRVAVGGTLSPEPLPMLAVYSSRLGEPAPGLVTLPGLARLVS